MKKSLIIFGSLVLASTIDAQSPIDAYQISQYDLQGTARYMSMGGAFGALGADLSAISTNPGGIGVYRSSEVGVTFGLDVASNSSEYNGLKTTTDRTRFIFNNVGIVGTLRLNSIFNNLNVGFTYNRGADFNRRYSGGIGSLKTSLSNYIAGIANTYNLTEADVRTTSSYDPYNPNPGQPDVPWSAILGYDSYLIDPEINSDGTTSWYGQFGNGTTGSGYFNVSESGGVDEYNFLIGGNIADVLFWGMNFTAINLNYSINSLWTENLQNAYVYDPNINAVKQQTANWTMDNLYSLNGRGFRYQLGFIVKPVQELRLGFAFHTPTYYNLTENFAPEYVDYNYPDFDTKADPENSVSGEGYAVTDNEYGSSNTINFRTPWRIVVSAAGVIGTNAILSFDYEWSGYKRMSYEQNGFEYWDNGWTGTPTAIQQTNNMIRDIYRNTSTFRVGAEYRVLPSLSLRAGYCFSMSPVTDKARSGVANIPTSGTLSSFRLDNNTNYVTCGLGYRYKGFYADLAYVWKHMEADYYPFSPDPANMATTAMVPKLTLNNSRILLSVGYKF